jgi:hypothetical protein
LADATTAKASETMNAMFCLLNTIPSTTATIPSTTVVTRETNSSLTLGETRDDGKDPRERNSRSKIKKHVAAHSTREMHNNHVCPAQQHGRMHP